MKLIWAKVTVTNTFPITNSITMTYNIGDSYRIRRNDKFIDGVIAHKTSTVYGGAPEDVKEWVLTIRLPDGCYEYVVHGNYG